MSEFEDEEDYDEGDDRQSTSFVLDTEEKHNFWNFYVILHWLGFLLFTAVFVINLSLAFAWPVTAHAEMTFSRARYDVSDPNEYVVVDAVVGSMSTRVFLVIPGLGMLYYFFLVFPWTLFNSKVKSHAGNAKEGASDIIDNRNNFLYDMYYKNAVEHGSGVKYLVSAVLWSMTVFMLGVYFRISDILINVLNLVLVMVANGFMWYYEQVVQHKYNRAETRMSANEKGKDKIQMKMRRVFRPIMKMFRRMGAVGLVLISGSLPHIILIIYFSMLSERNIGTIFAFSFMLMYYAICTLLYAVCIGGDWVSGRKSITKYMTMESVIILTQIIIIPSICLAVFVDIRDSDELWTV